MVRSWPDSAKNCGACEALFMSQLDDIWQRLKTSQTVRCGLVAYRRTGDAELRLYEELQAAVSKKLIDKYCVKDPQWPTRCTAIKLTG
jgi:hypothetical protein